MSGTGEVLAGIAAVASVSQLLAYTMKVCQALVVLVRRMEDAPSELKRLKRKALLLHNGLRFLTSDIMNCDDSVLLPPELRTLLELALEDLHGIIDELGKKCLKQDAQTICKLQNRFRFALLGRDRTESTLAQLRDSEGDLNFIIELFQLRISSLTFHSVHDIGNQLEAVTDLTKTLIAGKHHSADILGIVTSNVPKQRGLSRTSRAELASIPWFHDLGLRSPLGKLGFYCSINLLRTTNSNQAIQFLLGFKLPSWIANICISLYFQLSRSASHHGHISILPGYIRVQNRICIDSLFMKACKRGDINIIQQCIKDAPWLVNARSTCSGKTPLLLTIASCNLEAVQCLLEAGADPDIGDDERTIPVFAALGYKDERIMRLRFCIFVQLPPPTTIWLSMLRLLTQHGASIHEIVGGKTITMMNLSGGYDPCIYIQFFRFLIEEAYVDFELVDEQQGYSAVRTALGSHEAAIEALNTLATAGVDFKRVLPDGRLALHQAAEACSGAETIKHLYEKYRVTEINRQDQWGWTPLHYAVDSKSYKEEGSSCKTVSVLLDLGADPHMKSYGPIDGAPHTSSWLREPVSPVELATIMGPDVARRFRDDMKAIRLGVVDEEMDMDEFYDAQEQLSA